MQLSYPTVASECVAAERAGAGNYAWLVFALTFGLLLSDYMSRQVLNAVFPLLKAEWGLSDTRLGTLEVRQKISVAPSLGPFVIGGRMTPLIRKRVDRTRASHGLAARIWHDAAVQSRLGRRGISPIEGPTLQGGPLRRIFNGWKLRRRASFDEDAESFDIVEKPSDDRLG